MQGHINFGNLKDIAIKKTLKHKEIEKACDEAISKYQSKLYREYESDDDLMDMVFNKESLSLLSGDQLKKLSRHGGCDCHLEMIKLAQEDINCAFMLFDYDLKKSLLRRFLPNGIGRLMNLKNAFDANNPFSLYFGSKEKYMAHLMETEDHQLFIESLEWHHIDPEPKPKWQKDINAIINALSNASNDPVIPEGKKAK